MSPAISKINRLPDELADELDRRLVERKFSGYVSLSEWLNAELEKRGLEMRVSHAAIHRHGQKFADRLNSLQTATQMAKAIAEEAGDDEGALNTALLRLAQEKMFQLLLEFDEFENDEELRKAIPIILQKVTRAIADMSRASVQQNKWRVEFKKELTEKLATVERDAAGGDAAAALSRIRAIYGIEE